MLLGDFTEDPQNQGGEQHPLGAAAPMPASAAASPATAAASVAAATTNSSRPQSQGQAELPPSPLRCA